MRNIFNLQNSLRKGAQIGQKPLFQAVFYIFPYNQVWSVFLWLGSEANEGWFQLCMGEGNVIPDNGEFRRNDAYNNQPIP